MNKKYIIIIIIIITIIIKYVCWLFIHFTNKVYLLVDNTLYASN